MRYKQLTLDQRYEIYGLIQANFSETEIAKRLSVHKTTIYRELTRNTGQRGYRPKQAHQKSAERKKLARKHVRFTEAVKQRVEFFLKQDWCPEQISGHLANKEQIHISHEMIYPHIWADKRNGGTLFKHLRCSHKKRRKRYGSKYRRGIIKNRVSIDERPAIVDQKKRIGDWEIDTIIGKNHKGALVTAVERKTQFTCIEHVFNKSADMVTRALVNMLSPFKDRVLTITCDNGKEFAFHEHIAALLDADVYFAHPYQAWERGLNENINGLIRQYFPKNFDFRIIKKNDTSFVEKRLNQRPRKSLEFDSPFECFFNSFSCT